MRKTLMLDILMPAILEMNKGFAFVARKKRIITEEDKIRYIDLVFYHISLKCFVVIDIKIGKLTPQDIKQMQIYVNHYDRIVKNPEENKTIGIIFCKEKNQTSVEITLPEDSERIFASQYQSVLPDKQTFMQLLNQNYI